MYKHCSCRLLFKRFTTEIAVVVVVVAVLVVVVAVLVVVVVAVVYYEGWLNKLIFDS